MSPTTTMIAKFSAAAAAGGLVGYTLSRKKSRWLGVGLGATSLMLLYGIVGEGVLRPAGASS